MLSNFCEDKQMQDQILEHHEKQLGKIGIPPWANINCPFCGKHQPLRSIRSISWKLNPRNVGDIAVEVFCSECSKMDTLYFRSETKDVNDFMSLLKNDKQPISKPIIEEDMYKLKYNNAVEKMIKESNL